MTRFLLLVLALLVGGPSLAGGNNFNDRYLIPFPVLNAAVVSGAAVTGAIVPTTSAAVDVRGLSNFGFQFDVGTASPRAVGNYFIDVSQDYAENPANAGSWTTLNFVSATAAWSNAALSGTPAAVTFSGTPAAVFYREVTGSAAAYMRVRYVPVVTGGGVTTVYMSGK